MALLQAAKSWDPAGRLAVGNTGDMTKTRLGIQDLAEGPGMLPFHLPLLLTSSSLLRRRLPADGAGRLRGNRWGNATNLALTVSCCHVSSVAMVTTRPLVGAYLFCSCCSREKNGRRAGSWSLPQSHLGVGKRRGFITASRKLRSPVTPYTRL